MQKYLKKQMSKKTIQVWKIPLTGTYCFEVYKNGNINRGEYTKEDIERVFWSAHKGHVHVPDHIDTITDEIECIEEYEEEWNNGNNA